jgi:hypothetical protein
MISTGLVVAAIMASLNVQRDNCSQEQFLQPPVLARLVYEGSEGVVQ